MAKNNNLTDFLTDVANAIRAKKGTTAKINPQDFSSEISSIETGGDAILNQEKSIYIANNGTTEVTPDAGYTGLGKVMVNVNVPSSGGGEGGGSGDTPTPDMPVIGDGKTYLYIKIAEKGRMTVPLYFSQTVANGVTIDWGDGSATQTLSGTGKKNTSHTYAYAGEYTISLNPSSECTLGLGYGTSSYCVMGLTGNSGGVYRNMLQAVEIGKNVTSIGAYAFYNCYSLASVVILDGVTSIGTYAFQNCYSLASVVIPDSVTSIGTSVFRYCYSLASVVIPDSITSIDGYAFYNCYSLASVVIPDSITSIGTYAFYNCYSLASVVIPDSITSIGTSVFYNCYSLASVVIPQGVTTIGSYAFYYCYGMAFYDFRALDAVPTLSSTNAFTGIPSDCKIVVPDALYDEWIAASNWSTYASQIIKKSEWEG